MISSTWEIFRAELQRITQVLVNNDFPITLIDSVTSQFMDEKFDSNQPTNCNKVIIYYKNQFTSSSLSEEKRITGIIKKYVHTTQDDKTLDLRIYYQNRKLRSLLISNKTFTKDNSHHVVYKY